MNENLFISEDLDKFIANNSASLPTCLTEKEKENLLIKIWDSMNHAYEHGFNYGKDEGFNDDEDANEHCIDADEQIFRG